MAENLSIINPQDENLENNASDNAAFFVKLFANCVPLIGSQLAEVFGAVIPNQKAERAARFIIILNDRLKYVEEDVLKLKMKTEEFTDLLEDGFIFASRALNDERRIYIANLLKNSLTSNELNHIEKKKLLSLLNDLNDAEVITLEYNSILYPDQRKEFGERHESLFAPIIRAQRSPQENHDRGALRDSFRVKLIELNLLTPVYKSVKKGEVPEFDEKTGRLKSSSFRVTALGKLLLRYISDDSSIEFTKGD